MFLRRLYDQTEKEENLIVLERALLTKPSKKKKTSSVLTRAFLTKPNKKKN